MCPHLELFNTLIHTNWECRRANGQKLKSQDLLQQHRNTAYCLPLR
jgi:hypothetical protein